MAGSTGVSFSSVSTSMETNTQEVILDDAATLAVVDWATAHVERMASSLYKVRVIKGEPFMVVRGVGDANGIEAWTRIHQKYSLIPAQPSHHH